MERQKNESPVNRDADKIDLLQLFEGMWKGFVRFWWLVLLLVVLGAGGYLGFRVMCYEPMYRSSATFTVGTADSGSGSYSFYYNSSTADQLSRTFPYILESSFFRSALMERMGTDQINGTITAETITDSNVVTMTVKSPDASDAEEILSAALEIYPETARFVLGEIEFNYLDEPEVPQTPYNRPDPVRCLGVGGGAGLLAAFCFLGLSALFRKTARSPEEMKRITSLRCLATVPQVNFKARKKKQNQSISVWEKRVHHGYKESVRALQIRMEKELSRRAGKTLVITSTVSEEGKSTLAANLAETFAEKGCQVLLIDGDLRKQSDAKILRADSGFSLADVAKGEKTPREYVRKVRHSTLWFLGGNIPVKQPAPLLSSRKAEEFLEEMRKRMDYIIIDTPPSGMFQDAGILADLADGILYVVKYDFVSQQGIREGLTALQGKKTPVLGYVFNQYPESSSEYGYGRYGYGGYGYRRYGYDRYRYAAAEGPDDDGGWKTKETAENDEE